MHAMERGCKKVEQKKKNYRINPGKITIYHDFAGKIFEKGRDTTLFYCKILLNIFSEMFQSILFET